MALSDKFAPSAAMTGLDTTEITASAAMIGAVPHPPDIKTLAFIDSSLTDIEQLLASLQADRIADRIVVLNANQDGLQQITNVLADYQGLTSVAILAHGSAGSLQMGNARLTTDSLGSYAHQLQQWQSALTPDADLLFYGCNVAASPTGEALVQQIAGLTGADVAASTDLTGAAALGGDWDLEYATGQIDALSLVASEAIAAYQGILAPGTTFNISNFSTAASSIRVNGNAATAGTALRLTPALNGQRGSAFYNQAVALDANTSFNSQFQFQLGGGTNGADGFTFMLQNTASGLGLLGSGGGSLGYAGSGTGSVAIEFDTYKNGTADPNNNHVSVLRDGNVTTALAVNANPGFDLNGGGVINAWVDYDGATDRLQLFLSNTTVKPTTATLTTTIDLFQALGSQAYVGFSAATGGLNNSSDIRSWQFNSTATTDPGFLYNGNRYFLTNGALTWEQAQAQAVQRGGNLVTINDAAEETWLKQTFSGTESLWIGISDRVTEGQFRWVNGEAVSYTNWAPGEPNNYLGDQDYGYINFGSTRQWDDISGTAQFRGIIEVSPTAVGTIALENSLYSVNEAGGGVDVAVVRSGNSSGAATVQYRIDNGTAVAGSDFTGSSGTISFAAGQTRQTLRIPILNDNLVEGNETFGFVIQSPMGADLGTTRTASITIIDDDSPALTFGSPQVNENAGNATVTVTRGSGIGTASVNYSTANGTAIGGSDYSATSGTVSFAAGETSKSILIPLLNDAVGEPNETFTLNFSNPLGVTLPTTSTTVTVIDDDPGSFVREDVITGLTQPTAIAWTPNNQLLFILEKSGIIKVAQNNQVLSTNFADLTRDVNNVRDRGALGLTLHPDFGKGLGRDYVYVAYTYDPPEADRTGSTANTLDDADREGNRPARVVRLTADASNGFRTVVAGSQVVIVGSNSTWANTSRPDGNSTTDFSIPESGRTAGGGFVQDYIKTDSESHTIGQLAFGADGALYISVGDGASYNAVDARNVSVLNPDSLSGKVLRVDPLTGAGLADNPFWDGNASSNRSKVWNAGLRNPFRFTIKPGTSTPFIGDVGWKLWEEVNVGAKGANFGWAAYEGGTTTGVSTGTPTNLRQPEYDALNIPEIEAFYANGQVTAPIYARNHNEGARAIIMGDFYDGTTFPSIYNGGLFIADANEGTVDVLTLGANNQVTAVRRFASGLQGIVQMVTGADGSLYYVGLGGGPATGTIGRWRPN